MSEHSRGLASHAVRLAVTMGDPAGIGAEIVARLLAEDDLGVKCRIFAVGPATTVRAAQAKLGLPSTEAVVGAQEASSVLEPAGSGPSGNVVIDIDPGPQTLASTIRSGAVQAAAGELAYRAVCTAISLVQQDVADAVVTAPLNKAALQLAGHHYPGHTELLAELAGGCDVALMMAEERLKVTLATLHVPLAEVPRLLTAEAIVSAVRLTAEFLKRLGIPAPRLAVCGLNPHAGEGGIFGQEEERVIRPAIEVARQSAIDVSGPAPGDVVFHQAVQGRYDAVVAMYHDQGLIPVKLLSFGRAVNVTLGLPFVRTSVDHGTAFDIAGRGIADAGSLKLAARMAARWVERWRRARAA